jgi:hypothetical protein
MRKVLEELFQAAQLTPSLLALERVALARAWWRQSKGELKNGMRRSALASLGRAVCLAPTRFDPIKVLRQVKRILLSRTVAKNPLANALNGVNVQQV